MTIYNVVTTIYDAGDIKQMAASFTTSEKANDYLSSKYESYKTDRSLIQDEEWEWDILKDGKFDFWHGGFPVEVVGEVIACELQ